MGTVPGIYQDNVLLYYINDTTFGGVMQALILDFPGLEGLKDSMKGTVSEHKRSYAEPGNEEYFRRLLAGG
jgi:hypothetical protein